MTRRQSANSGPPENTVLCIFEDEGWKQFVPLTYTRPVFDLWCGTRRLWERLLSDASVRASRAAFLCRRCVTAIAARTLDLPSADALTGGVSLLLVNGRLVTGPRFGEALCQVPEGSGVAHEGTLLVAHIPVEAVTEVTASDGELNAALFAENVDSWSSPDSLGEDWAMAESPLADYPWDLVALNPRAIDADFPGWGESTSGDIHPKAVIYNHSRVHVAEGAVVDAFAVLDAREGSVVIDRGAKVAPFSWLKGPCYVGPGTAVVGGTVGEGTTLGGQCRIRGEVQNSVFQGYSNKYHDGFVGHSYVGEWVNLGALTTTSDLKNNYGSVRVQIGRERVDSGKSKVGCIVADHAKTGIGTMLSTGGVIGVASNVYGADAVMPPFVPSFAWGNARALGVHRPEKAVETAAKVFARRNREFEERDRELLLGAFAKTCEERAGLDGA